MSQANIFVYLFVNYTEYSNATFRYSFHPYSLVMSLFSHDYIKTEID